MTGHDAAAVLEDAAGLRAVEAGAEQREGEESGGEKPHDARDDRPPPRPHGVERQEGQRRELDEAGADEVRRQALFGSD